MRIVPQAAPPAHSLFTTSFLLLPAPRIAGLLPAHVGVEPEAPPQATFPTFTYTHPNLAELSDERRDSLFRAAKTLMDVALDFNLNGLAEDQLRAAEVLFHRAAGGSTPKHFRSPVEFAAERDADVMNTMVNIAGLFTGEAMAARREKAKQTLEEMLRAYRAENHHE